MCSAAAKFEHSRQRPSGPSDTFSGSHSESPGRTFTDGMIKIRLVPGSCTRNSSANGAFPRLVILTAEAPAETTSTTFTPSANLPDRGLGTAVECSPVSRGDHFRKSAASRRRAAVVGRSSPLSPTAPFRKKEAPSTDQPAGYSESSTSLHRSDPKLDGLPATKASRLRANALGSLADRVMTGVGGETT